MDQNRLNANALASSIAHRLASPGRARGIDAPSLTSAVARRLASPGRTKAVNASALASAITRRLASPGRARGIDAPSLTSAVARRFASPGRTKAVNASALASAITRRLASPSRAKPEGLRASVLADSLTRRIVSWTPGHSQKIGVPISKIDSDALANSVVEKLTAIREKMDKDGPSANLASAIANKLAAVNIVASPAALDRFSVEIASGVSKKVKPITEEGLKSEEIDVSGIVSKNERGATKKGKE